MAESLLALLATYLVHSTLLLASAWLLDVSRVVRGVAVRETLWRAALFGALLTTAVASWPARAPAGASDGVAMSAAASQVEPAPRAAGRDAARVAAPRPAAPRPSMSAPPDFSRASYAVPRLPEWPQRVLALLFGLGAVAGVARLALALVRERRAARALPPCDDPAFVHEAHELASRLGAPVPALRYADDGAGPYATSPASICVPRWAAGLDARQRRGMLAHELAHLARRDPAWRAACELVARLAWLQPLNRLAVARLDALAELDCDARAAHALGDGRPLASCLAACAERLAAPVPLFAAAMSRRRSALVERIESLLEEPAMPRPATRFAARTLALGALAAAIAALPVVQFRAHAAPAPAERGGTHVSHVSTGWGSSTFRMKSDSLGVDVEIDGEVEFDAAESDIVSLSDEATIEQTVGGVEHRVEFENDGGKVARRYFVDGSERPLDAAGRTWLAEVIPLVLREGAFDVDRRVARIRARGGAGAVLDETDRIQGDHARRSYLVALAEDGPLLPAEIDRAIAIAGKTGSDFEQRTTFTSFIEQQALAPAQHVTLLEATAKIESDFEQRTVLEALAPKLVVDEPVAAAWAKTLATIESDFEARTVIEAMAENDGIPASAVQLALRNTRQLGSDFERRTALAALAPHLAEHGALVSDYTASASGIGSDFERRTALVELLEEVELDAAACREVLESSAGISSDFEKRTVLVELAEHMPADEALIRRYREITRGMGDHERMQAEKALDRFAL